MARILIAGLDKNLGILLKSELEDEGHAVDLMLHGSPVTPDDVERSACEVLLFGMSVPCLDYFKRLDLIKRRNPETHIIIFSEGPRWDETIGLFAARADALFDSHELGRLKSYLRRSSRYRRPHRYNDLKTARTAETPVHKEVEK